MQKFLYSFIFFMTMVCNANAAPPPEAFGQLPGTYDAAISPDANNMAVIVNQNGQYVVQIVNLKNSNDASGVGLGKGVKPLWVKWANNTQVLVSFWQSEKLGGVPVTTGYIYTLDTETMKGKILVRPGQNGSTGSRLGTSTLFRQYNNDVIDFLDNDPDHILMAYSDVGNTHPPDIKKVNVATGRDTTVKRGLSNVQTWYTDLRGEPRIGQGLKDKSTEQWVLRIREVNGDKWHNSDDYPGLNANASIYGFTKDPNELIIGAYQGKDTRGLYVYDLRVKKMTRKLFHNDKYDVGNVILNSDGSDVIGVSYVGESVEKELFDAYDTSLDYVRSQLPDRTIDFIDQSKNSEYILFNASNAYDPGGLMIMETSTKKIQMLKSKYAKLEPNDLGLVVNVRYSARDGVKIPAYVTLPPTVNDTASIKNLPFIVLPHGGPYARESDRFDYLAQFFATRGYGVLQMNFRGSSGYGKTFEDQGRENWVVMQEDVEDGAKWLLKKGYADPDRMCIAGWSYGGYAALMGALKNPDLYSCAISMAGVTDLQDIIRDVEKYQFGKITARNFILKGFESKDDIKANSPVKLADTLITPLFLAHGTADQRVHFDQYKRMKSALRKSDADVTYLEFKEEDHFLSNQNNRQKFLVEIDKFLKKHIGKSEFVKP